MYVEHDITEAQSLRIELPDGTRVKVVARRTFDDVGCRVGIAAPARVEILRDEILHRYREGAEA